MTGLLLGMALGLGAGLSPGPLMAMVVSATVERGFGAGARVAMAPLVTDGPLILVAALVGRALPEAMLEGLAVAGAAYLFWMGGRTLVRSGAARLPEAAAPATARRDLRRGVVANIVNPHPWVFWITVGVPALGTAWDRSPLDAIGFLAGFYTLLIGTKVVIAALVAAGRRRMNEPWYRGAVIASGLILLAAGALLLVEVFRA